jgi:hypothetical protein
LISEGVKEQGQIVCDGFRTCLMAFRIITGVVVGVVAGGDEVYHHSSARVIAGGVCAHLNARGPLVPSRRGKNLPLHGGRHWSPPTWPLRACTASSPGRRRTDLFHGVPRKMHGGRHTGIAHLRCHGTSLSWRGQRTTLRTMDGDVLVVHSSCRTSP